MIGENGDRLKSIGREARLDMERALGTKVMLNLWVKVKRGWSDDERALKSFGLRSRLSVAMSPEPAFLLHRRPYRETSALVDLLTLNNGRVRAVAHGGQRPGSKSRQRLQPFTPLFVTWQGSRELKRLTLMESRGQTALLAGEGLLCGLYANEIATRLLPLELPAADVFAFYTALLEALPAPAERGVGIASL
ncbi:hypothetical protein HSBAA_26080 [Vreelandella sulfidaeris]|uniref:DNA repair protein RecO n=1 Tax=Vreelandella sulfidaeris TaxID=115553 RepID=A0A455U5B7_9GAMM|nr:hypothetical protein HSBAA_26080 [Halomonas sulfidaeris]